MNNLFEYRLQENKITFLYTSSPTITEREVHSYHEILFFTGDTTEIFCEGVRHTVFKNTLFIIPEGTYHFFKTANDSLFERLKISVHEALPPFDRLFKSFFMIENLSYPTEFILKRLCEAVTEKRTAHAMAAFNMLLSELDLCEHEETFSQNKSAKTAQVLEYISENLAGDLSLDILSKKLAISPSTLTHSFKEEVGTSLHEYVTQKRLALAKKLILDGNKPSKIYLECGYRDYSSFYKAWVKYFGYSPSEKKGQ